MAQALNETTLRSWMQKLGPRLVRHAAAICRDRHQAEEIVQEAFVKLWRKPPDAGEIAYTSWMRRVVTNLSINALQRTKRPSVLPEFTTDPALMSGERPDQRIGRDESMDAVRAAMERLDPAKRTILVLRAVEQLSYEEIAEHLSIPIGTVMSRLNRARTALADELKRGANAEEDLPASFPFRAYQRKQA
ncbi:MAG: RNA polymerase sigma factor [Phycisphaerales bacterium]|nr:RNA polymerase sigma factor [Phycisphaerae bacterium]NNF42791.1 RNA polymerase sigma factor [Phycisphaerales bacterium]NNM27704.1 RNA polymerase sigma factor [Phycisphaerales bacterium]